MSRREVERQGNDEIWYNPAMKRFGFLLSLFVPLAVAAGVAVGPLPAPDYAYTEVTRRGVDASAESVSVERFEQGFRVRLL